jgi:hypothetical protein
MHGSRKVIFQSNPCPTHYVDEFTKSELLPRIGLVHPYVYVQYPCCKHKFIYWTKIKKGSTNILSCLQHVDLCVWESREGRVLSQSPDNPSIIFHNMLSTRSAEGYIADDTKQHNSWSCLTSGPNNFNSLTSMSTPTRCCWWKRGTTTLHPDLHYIDMCLHQPMTDYIEPVGIKQIALLDVHNCVDSL